MAVNTISGSNGGSPVELYKVNQNDQSAVNRSRQEESAQRSNQKEDTFSVQISQEAVALQKQTRAKKAEFDQKLQAERQVQNQVNTEMQAKQAEAKEYNKQQSVDIVV